MQIIITSTIIPGTIIPRRMLLNRIIPSTISPSTILTGAAASVRSPRAQFRPAASPARSAPSSVPPGRQPRQVSTIVGSARLPAPPGQPHRQFRLAASPARSAPPVIHGNTGICSTGRPCRHYYLPKGNQIQKSKSLIMRRYCFIFFL